MSRRQGIHGIFISGGRRSVVAVSTDPDPGSDSIRAIIIHPKNRIRFHHEEHKEHEGKDFKKMRSFSWFTLTVQVNERINLS